MKGIWASVKQLRWAGGAIAAAGLVGGLMAAPLAGAAGASGAATGFTIYSSIPSPLPPNLPSVGAEAYAFRELGDQVVFAGAARQLTTVDVALSDWACQVGTWYGTGADACTTTPGSGFSLPMTFTIYAVGPDNAVGALLATDQQTFTIPYRPSSDPAQCPDGQSWYDPATAACYDGLDTTVTFDFSSQSVALPGKVIYGISYDTTHYGPNPVGASAPCYSTSAGCGYDSLNIALAPQVYTGAQAVPGTVYQNSPYGGEYCDSGAAGTNTFRLDSPTSACWAGYVPAVAFHAANPVTSASQCRHGGWASYTDSSGQTFKNQGDCVSYVATGGRNPAAG